MSGAEATKDILQETIHIAEAAPLKPLHGLPEIHIAGIDLSINMMVVTLFISVILVFFFIFAASRKTKLVPGPVQSMAEAVILFVRNSVVMEMMGKNGLPWLPFLTTIFLFILFNNLLGLIPGLATPTSSIYVTFALAMIIFFAIHVTGVVKHGPWKYFKALVLPGGAPVWLAPLFVPLELISALAKPFSLMVRLFANMFAGHTVMVVFIGLILLYGSYVIAPFPLLLSVAVGLLEIGFKILQAYVFTVLSAMYIGDALHGGH